MKERMRKITVLMAGAALCLNLFAQQENPVIMRVNGKDVTRSEFEYSFNKNNAEKVTDPKALDEYVDLFVDFKLKVAAAEEMGLDTLSTFKREYKSFRDQQAEEYLIDTTFIETQARLTYDETARNIGEGGMVLSQHILLMIPQGADEAVQAKIKARMDSIYNVLQAGGDFTDLATRFSEDPGSARQGGMLPWLFAKQVYPEFANEVYALEKGSYSKPFLSPAGVHVVKLIDRKPFELEPYEYHRDAILKFLQQRGIRQAARQAKADVLFKEYGGKVARDKVLAYEDSLLETKYPEFGLLMQEYHDGLLLFEASNRCVWEKAAKDEEGLERYFKKNKKKYAWDTPRFKGAVLHCTTPELLKQVKKKLKKMPQEQWRNYVASKVNQDTLKLAYIERGLYKAGDNKYVDMLVFGQGEVEPMKEYPYAAACGKKQKKYPASYKDVRGPLTADYQSELEKAWVASLRSKFAWEVYPEVVKTVNNH